MFKDLLTLSGQWGRLNRLRYFWLWLLSIVGWVVSIVLVSLVTVGGEENVDVSPAGGMAFLMLAFYFLFLWVQICLNAKRLHDLGFSGWLGLVPVGLTLITNFVSNPDPTVNLVLLILNLAVLAFSIWLLFWPGEAGENQFGPDPLDQ